VAVSPQIAVSIADLTCQRVRERRSVLHQELHKESTCRNCRASSEALVALAPALLPAAAASALLLDSKIG
jgi:hypothetical protein